MKGRDVLFGINRIGSLRLEEKLRVYEAYQGEETFRSLRTFDLECLLGRRLSLKNFSPSSLLAQGQQDRLSAEAGGTCWTSFLQPEYPSLLRTIYAPPLILYWRGTLPPEDSPALGVVGTRKPTLGADRAAFALGFDAARKGVPLISGMALGIDGTAHRGTLAGGGKTWAVLGTSCEKPYPSQHRQLAAQIIQGGGGLLSEFPPGTGAAPYNFPKRNRLISALSQGVVLVQAPRRSGALYTADFALQQGRDVYVHSQGLQGNLGGGTRKLRDEGAPVISSLGDICRDWERPPLRPLLQEADQAGALQSQRLRQEMAGELVWYKGRVHQW